MLLGMGVTYSDQYHNEYMKHPKFETTPEISKRMSQVRLKRGIAETMLAKALWRRGIRYRLNYRALTGSPDIAILKHKIAVFVDGEFWHGHDWANRKPKLKRNREYWIEKIEENIARDVRNDALLRAAGWAVVHFWEKEVLKGLDACVDAVIVLIPVKDNVSLYQDDISKLRSDPAAELLVAEPGTAYEEK